jgi:hypothetical protein
MNMKATHRDSDTNNEYGYFDAMRQKNYEASFDGIEQFVEENKARLSHTRHRKSLRKWQWVLAVMLPVVVVLACTKTEHNEPVGNTISFTVPDNDDATRQELESLLGGLQTIVSPVGQKPGHIAYTCFIPAQSSRSVDAVVTQLKKLKGITGLSTVPVNAQVKASLLSQLGNKIFSTHIDATALSDDELQNSLMRQLKEKGFNNISVTVGRDGKGIRSIQLHPAKDANNYIIDLSVTSKGTRMVLQEERRANPAGGKAAETSKVDFGSMTDAQVREYIRAQYGKELPDEKIKITRSSDEIEIAIIQSDEKEEIMRFRIH